MTSLLRTGWIMVIAGIAFVAQVQAVQWSTSRRHAGQLNQLGLSELVAKLQGTSSSAGSASSTGLVDQINQLINSAAATVSQSQTLVAAEMNELNVTNNLINRTLTLVQSNENQRIAITKQYNQDVLTLNDVLVDMTTGAQQVNDVISVANRVRKNIAEDIFRINEAVNVTNDWMVKMDSWAAFITDETKQMDQAQANLVKWGDATKNNINLHEVTAIKLGRETYDLETQIADMNNIFLSTGSVFGVTPTTLTIAEASGGLGWTYSYWS